MSIVIATLGPELAEHWLAVLSQEGIAAETAALPNGELEIRVKEEDEAKATALFAEPFEGDEEDAGPEVEGPPLGAGERTELLVRTDQVLIAQKLCAALHRQGLFAEILSTSSSSLFGVDGAQSYSIVVASTRRAEAFAALHAWASNHDNDFTTELGLTREELLATLARLALGQLR